MSSNSRDNLDDSILIVSESIKEINSFFSPVYDLAKNIQSLRSDYRYELDHGDYFYSQLILSNICALENLINDYVKKHI